ncbi:PREDICTED: NADPH oxidase 5 [Polistes canadensis]|uniref:NADPH oxidase 5 n=1 Tax=Polistes canadensis TaxID=91411 RepID=UPI000718FFD1|nr:PREDICTED: NADPH oxidase 5 [Polistes canadensis]
MEENTSSMEEECFLLEKRRTEILKECSELLKGDNRHTRETFRKLFQEQIFLEKLFRLFDQDRDELLKQDEWIEFMKSRLTNEKQQDFIDQIESVAFVLCAEKPLNFTSFVQLFCAKGIVDKLFRLIDQENSGYVTTIKIMEFINDVSNPRPRGGFDKRSLEWLENIFKQTVGNQKEIRREEFKNIVTSKNPFFTERVFQIFDKDNSGTISLQEFIDAMNEFAGKSADDKIKFLFRVYDIDDDGFIQYRELEHVMRACMEENGMKFSDEQIEELTIALFEDADTCNRGAITLEGLKKQLEKHDGFLENLSISIDRWLVPPKPKDTKKPIFHGFLSSLQPHQLTMPYIKNNYVYITFICIILTINLILFLTRIIEYRQNNVYVILARACGQCLNFNCTFVLVLMLRQCITFLRINGFSSILPLDHHIYLHKMTGILIIIFGLIHTIMHLLNFGTVVINDDKLNNSNYTMAEWIFTSKPKLFGLVGGCANPTGIALIIILLIMTVCSLPFVRRGGCFEIFYWSHLLYVPFWILMIFHGPNFWKWFVVPGTIYLFERIRRLVWSRSQRGKTYIKSGLLLPSKVTHLVIKRPPNFDFHPGDYVFVNIPVIARYEWHPFTISSAPELKDYIWLHIRALGEWTNTLYLYFEREHMKLHRGDDLSVDGASTNNVNLTRKKSFLSVNIGKKNKDDSCSLSDSRGIDNLVFVADVKASSSSNSTINDTGTFLKTPECTPKMIKMTEEPKLRQFLLASKLPLEKSFSVPDMQTRYKNKQRSIALRDYGRSESEKSFDECQIRRACTKLLGRAYLSPQNKSLAESVRYMRTKPTIIAFETPSLENFEYDEGTNLNNKNKNCTSPTCSIREEAAEEGRLNNIYEEMRKIDQKTKSIEIKIETASNTTIDYPIGKPLEIFLDGPYGAPSSHIFQAQHAVLIATGIGVTPFASILRSIMHRYWEARQTCPKCQFSWANEIPPTIMHLRKVDFFWINRDQHSFEWFVNLLSQLEMEQAELGNAMEPFLEMYMYITSALQKHDMKAVGLQLAMDLLHEKEKRDLITGLKTRTNAGRPNWDKVFKQLRDRKKGKITVFYCGPPQLAKILRHKCDQFGFKFRKESF